jgi:hypothetical protein
MPPSNQLRGLQIWNTRILRTGNEALQIQNLGDGTRVWNSVFANGGMHWLDNGLGRYQDNDSQIQVRQGAVEIDHDIFVDGAGTLASFWQAPESGDGERQVHFHDDYFAQSLDLGLWIGGAGTPGSSLIFENSTLASLSGTYLDAASTMVFGVDSKLTSPLTLTGLHYQGSRDIATGIKGANGTYKTITAHDNDNSDVTPIQFVNPGYPIVNPGHHLTVWAANVTVESGMPAAKYLKGDVVAHGAAWELYQANEDTSVGPPDQHPEVWDKLPHPIDDVRALDGYSGYGVQ